MSTPSPARQVYLVVFLTTAATLSIVDRQILALMIGPMRRDLGVSDTMMGLLGGVAFALLYSVISLPAAQLADTGNRSRLILGGIALWSLMSGGCAFVHRYALLFLLRMGVSVGEAALGPASYSLMSAAIAPANLPLAIGLFSASPFLGTSLASIGGGALIAHFEAHPLVLPVAGALLSWQATFLLIGVAGLVLWLIGVATMREPPRAPVVHDEARVGEIPRLLRANARLLVCHFASLSFMSIQGWAFLYWVIEFFVRQHAMGRAEIGLFYGVVALVCGLGGSLAAGALTSAMLRRGRTDAPLRVVLVTIVVLLPLAVALPLVPTKTAALTLLVPLTLAMAFPGGPATTALQFIVPDHLKARIVAFYLLIVNFIALSVGPLMIGLISDTVFEGRSIGNSLAVMALVTYPLSFVFLLAAMKPYRRAVVAAESYHAHPLPLGTTLDPAHVPG